MQKRPVLAIIVGVIILLLLGSLFVYEQNQERSGNGGTVSPVSVQEKNDTSPSAIQEAELAFDTVRVDRDGNAVLAGRGTPGRAIYILDGVQTASEAILGDVIADATGSWVFVPTEKLASGQHTLGLKEARPDDTWRYAKETVVLLVPDAAETAPTLSVSLSEKGDVRPLQDVAEAPGMVLSIEVIHSDAVGDITVSGHALAGALIRLYVDNTFMGETQTSTDKNWKAHLKTALKDESVTVRADHVDTDGKVLARVAVGFVREKIDAPSEMAKVTVERGNSLWRIAQSMYGDGFDYVIIYQANKEQIRNPDLIFPGQVFMLPRRADDGATPPAR